MGYWFIWFVVTCAMLGWCFLNLLTGLVYFLCWVLLFCCSLVIGFGFGEFVLLGVFRFAAIWIRLLL